LFGGSDGRTLRRRFITRSYGITDAVTHHIASYSQCTIYVRFNPQPNDDTDTFPHRESYWTSYPQAHVEPHVEPHVEADTESVASAHAEPDG
jgi:hypothetical protein